MFYLITMILFLPIVNWMLSFEIPYETSQFQVFENNFTHVCCHWMKQVEKTKAIKVGPQALSRLILPIDIGESVA